ncbi:MAG: hypothetical protein ABR929_15105 [Roseiarcus sp.]
MSKDAPARNFIDRFILLPWPRGIVIIIISVVLLGAAVCYIYALSIGWRYMLPKIDPLFETTYKLYQEDLGNPLRSSVNSSDGNGVGKYGTTYGAYQVTFDYGSGFWTFQSQRLYMLQETTDKWFARQDNMSSQTWMSAKQNLKI